MNAITLQAKKLVRRQGDISIKLDLSALDYSAKESWRQFIEFAGKAVGINTSVSSFLGQPPDDGSLFAYVSNSAGLSRKLLMNMPCIYVQPNTPPLWVDAFIHTKLNNIDVNMGGRLRPVRHNVTLISSVFRGDEFLPGFLENCAQLHGYRECEHFLIRAASPGDEHALLIRHVRDWPSAVYLNLYEDPGLYEVWNTGIHLATGCYLSNANIDDRRAPEHLVYLQGVLSRHPEVGAASTALRITTQRNLAWQDSADCKVMFGSVDDKVYSAIDLFQKNEKGLASRNLLHCMPVWRRSLHTRVGSFNEKRYGPSADWAFWLITGSKGAKFHFSRKPMGLYLRDEGSYWRRNRINTQFDSIICREFGYLATTTAATSQAGPVTHFPFSLVMSVVLESFRTGACFEGVALLLYSATQATTIGGTAQALLNKVALHWLGCHDFNTLAMRYNNTCDADPKSETALFNTLVDLVQAYDPRRLGASAKRIRHTLELAFVDFHECSENKGGLLALALLARKDGDLAAEKSLLRLLHDENPARFWVELQSVYRFVRSLPDLCAAVSSVAPIHQLQGEASDTQLVFYPYYSGNAYQELLYDSLRRAGAEVKGTLSEAEFLTVAQRPGMGNILHVHWVNRLFGSGNPSKDVLAQRAMDFLDGLLLQKQRGFKIYWTIHNRLSHESADPSGELAFRQALYKLADRVFVHHPLAAHLLDWLPDQDKLFLCEHGNYGVDDVNCVTRSKAREDLGIAQDEFVVGHVGHIRDYKGLVDYLPILREQLNIYPRMKVVIAGCIISPAVRYWLEEHPHPHLIVRDTFLSDDELTTLMRASDIGFLSYSAVLTSGTLMHWFTCGRPVLAPNTGGIPAYVADGWNGFCYRDSETLKHLLSYCATLPRAELDFLADNAQKTAGQLEWGMWKA